MSWNTISDAAAFTSWGEEDEEEQKCTPLQSMSSLLHHLPPSRSLKRGGLSKHYSGKSQSFTCLTKVRSVEDLAKQENPYNKKLKSPTSSHSSKSSISGLAAKQET